MKLFLRACPAVKGFEGYREKGENVRICRNTAVDLPGKEKMNILHEILRTVLVREFGEILIVGAIYNAIIHDSDERQVGRYF